MICAYIHIYIYIYIYMRGKWRLSNHWILLYPSSRTFGINPACTFLQCKLDCGAMSIFFGHQSNLTFKLWWNGTIIETQQVHDVDMIRWDVPPFSEMSILFFSHIPYLSRLFYDLPMVLMIFLFFPVIEMDFSWSAHVVSNNSHRIFLCVPMIFPCFHHVFTMFSEVVCPFHSPGIPDGSGGTRGPGGRQKVSGGWAPGARVDGDWKAKEMDGKWLVNIQT